MMRWLWTVLLLLPLVGCPAAQKDTSTATGNAPTAVSDPPEGTPVVVWVDPLLEKPLTAVAKGFAELYPPGIIPVYLERGELLDMAAGTAPPDPPDVIITGDNEVYLALLAAGLLDEVTARVFAGDSLTLVQKAETGYRTSTLYDVYKLRFEGFAIGALTTTTGYYGRQALFSEGGMPRLEDRLIVVHTGAGLAGSIAAGNPPIGILCTSSVVQSQGLEVMLPIDEALHEDIRYRATAVTGSAGNDGVMALLSYLAENAAVQELLVGYGLTGRIQALDESL